MAQNFDVSGLNKDKEFLKVALLPDFHWLEESDGGVSTTILPATINSINAQGVDVVYSLGDQMESGAYSIDSENPLYYPTAMGQFFTEMESLDAPWVWVNGNHDWSWADHPDAATRPTSAQMAVVYDSYNVDYSVPKLVTMNGWDFLSFDWTDEYFDALPGSTFAVPADDLAWIAANITKYRPLVLINHYGLVEATGGLNPTNEDVFMQALVDNGDLKFCINGHIHREEFEYWRGIPQVSVRRLGPTALGDDRGWAMFEISKDKVSYYDMKIDGTATNSYVRYSF